MSWLIFQLVKWAELTTFKLVSWAEPSYQESQKRRAELSELAQLTPARAKNRAEPQLVPPLVLSGFVVSDFLNYYPFRRIVSGIFNRFWIILRFGKFDIGAFILQMIDFIHVGHYIWNEKENCNYDIRV